MLSTVLLKQGMRNNNSIEIINGVIRAENNRWNQRDLFGSDDMLA